MPVVLADHKKKFQYLVVVVVVVGGGGGGGGGAELLCSQPSLYCQSIQRLNSL